MTWLSPSIALLALAASPSAEPPEVARFSVVVGYNGTHDGSRDALRFADDDAARFFELLLRASERAWLLTTFDRESQEAFPDLVALARSPTRGQLQRTLREVAELTREAAANGARTEVAFYYAGHGDVASGVGFVHLADGKFTSRDFRTWFLDGVGSDRKHVIVDACRSYFLVSSRGAGGERERLDVAYGGPTRRPGVGYVLSTSNDAESHEWSAFAGGIFSHEVRSALVGGADLDRDGAVDYEELAAFVAVANEGVPLARFRPQFFIRSPDGERDASLFEPARLIPSTRLAFEPEAAGRFQIVDSRGLPYAELNKATGSPLSVVLLGPGPYTVRWNELRLRADTSRPTLAMAELPRAPPEETTARSQPHEAFRHLFSTPLSPDVLRGVRLGLDVAPSGAAHARATTTRPAAPRWLVAGGLVLAGAGAGLIAGGAAVGSEIGDPSLSQADRVSRAETRDALVVSGLITAGVGVAMGVVGAWLWSE